MCHIISAVSSRFHNTSCGSRERPFLHVLGLLETLVTDNGSQLRSREFKAFTESWSFNHITTSPRYPQWNGKVENAVETVKRLFEKCKESNLSKFQALLDWRNTPTEGMDTSPAQRLMGRHCRTLLSMSESLLKPSYPLHDDACAMSDWKRRQKHYYDRHNKNHFLTLVLVKYSQLSLRRTPSRPASAVRLREVSGL